MRNNTLKTPQNPTRSGGRKWVWLIALGLSSQPLYAMTNYFSYDALHLQLGAALFDQPIVLEHTNKLGSDEYKVIPLWGFRGSYQHPATGLIFSANTTQAQQSTQHTKLQQTSYSFKLGYALGFFNRFDIYTHLGQYINDTKACAETNCIKLNQKNQGIDLGFRAWAKPNIEWGINQRINNIREDQKNYSTSLQLGYLLSQHSALTTSLLYSEKDAALTVGFRYSF